MKVTPFSKIGFSGVNTAHNKTDKTPQNSQLSSTTPIKEDKVMFSSRELAIDSVHQERLGTKMGQAIGGFMEGIAQLPRKISAKFKSSSSPMPAADGLKKAGPNDNIYTF